MRLVTELLFGLAVLVALAAGAMTAGLHSLCGMRRLARGKSKVLAS